MPMQFIFDKHHTMNLNRNEQNIEMLKQFYGVGFVSKYVQQQISTPSF